MYGAAVDRHEAGDPVERPEARAVEPHVLARVVAEGDPGARRARDSHHDALAVTPPRISTVLPAARCSLPLDRRHGCAFEPAAASLPVGDTKNAWPAAAEAEGAAVPTATATRR
jgi:hypothetical protein